MKGYRSTDVDCPECHQPHGFACETLPLGSTVNHGKRYHAAVTLNQGTAWEGARLCIVCGDEATKGIERNGSVVCDGCVAEATRNRETRRAARI